MCVLSKKNREKERGKCLICIKICICNSRVKFSICGFRNWWEQATRCTVSSSLSLFLYLCTWTVYLHVCAIWNMQFIVHGQAQILCWQVYVWANVKFSLSEQQHWKFSLSIPKCHILSEILSLLVAIPRLTHSKGA